jgi:tellurite resistance protein
MSHAPAPKKLPAPRSLLIEAMTLMIAADGVVADEEILELSRLTSEHPMFAGTPASAVTDTLKRSLKALAKQGFEARLLALAEGLPDYNTRLLAFAFAVSICFADGQLADQELSLLKAFQSVFGLREEHVTLLVSAAQDRADFNRVLFELGVEGDPRLLRRDEAMIEVMLLMATADDEIQAAEVTRMALTVASRPEFQEMSEADVGEAISSALHRIQTHGLQSRLAELRLCLPDAADRIQALRFAISILVADGQVTLSELNHLERMRVAFDLEEDQVESLKREIT